MIFKRSLACFAVPAQLDVPTVMNGWEGLADRLLTKLSALVLGSSQVLHGKDKSPHSFIFDIFKPCRWIEILTKRFQEPFETPIKNILPAC